MDGSAPRLSETTKLSIVITGSLLIATVVTLIQKYELLPSFVVFGCTPFLAYVICFCLTLIIQQISCGKINLSGAGLGTLGVASTTAVGSLVLALENVPLLTYIEPLTGEFLPMNPLTGQPFPPNSLEYTAAMENMNHKKIQYFSNIVKAALPVSLVESTKQSFATFYWLFWLTMLPFYFSLSLQANC